MATILEIFRAVAPEYGSITDANIQVYIDLAIPQVDESQFGTDYNLAVAYLAADILSMAIKQRDSSVGIASSKKAGDLAITYAMPNVLDSYSYSIYGEMFKRLLDKHILGVVVANSSQ